MPDDSLNLSADASSLIRAVEAAAAAVQKYYDATDKAVQQTVKINEITGKLTNTYTALGESGEKASISFEKLGNSIKVTNVQLAGTQEQVAGAAAQFDKLTQKLSLSAAKAGDFKTAFANIKNIQTPELRATTQQQVVDIKTTQSGAASNIARSLRRDVEKELSQVPAAVNKQFGLAVQEMAKFGAQTQLTTGQVQAAINRVKSGKITLFDPETQAQAAKLQDLAIKVVEAQGRVTKAVTSNQAAIQQSGRIESVAREENIRRIQKESDALQKSGRVESNAREENIRRIQRESDTLQKAGRIESGAREENITRIKRQAAETQQLGKLRATADEEDIRRTNRLEKAIQSKGKVEVAAREEDSARVLKTNEILRSQQAASTFYSQLGKELTALGKPMRTVHEGTGTIIEQHNVLSRTGEQWVATITKQNGAVTSMTRQIYEQGKANEALYVSWQSVARIVTGFAINQAIFGMLNTMQQSIELATNLQVTIAQIQTISENGMGVDAWAKGILAISNATGLLADDVAKGTYDVLSNQIADGGQALEFMAKAGKLAVVTNSSLQDSINAVSSAMNSYGYGLEQQTRIQDVFFRMIDLGRIKMPEFANSLGRVLPGAQELGVSLEEVAAFISTTTRQGITAANSMTYLFNIFSRMLKPAGEMKEFLHGMGVESGKAAIETYGFLGVIKKIAEFAQNRPDLAAQLFPDIRGLRGILAVTADGAKAFTQDLDGMKKAFGAVDEAGEKFINNVGKKFQIEMQRIQNYFTGTLGTTVLEVFDTLNGQTNRVSKSVTVLADAMLALGGPVVAGGLLNLAKNSQILATALGALKTPLIGWVVAITAAGLALKAVLDDYTESIEKAQRDSEEFYATQVEKAKKVVEEGLKPLDTAINDTMQAYKYYVAQLNVQYDQLAEQAKTNTEAIVESFKNLNYAFVDYLKGLISATRDQLNDVKSQLKDIEKFVAQGAEAMRKKILDAQLEETEDPVAKQKLLQQELQRTREEMAKAVTTDQREQLYQRQINLVDELRRLQVKSAKDEETEEKNRKKLLEERAKLQAKLRDLERKGTIDTLEDQDKINKLSKKGPVIAVNGKIQGTNLGTSLAGAKDALQDDKRNRDITNTKNRLKEIDDALNGMTKSGLQRIDAASEYNRILKERQELEASLQKQLEGQQKQLEEQINNYEMIIKQVQDNAKEIEKFKIDSLFKPKADEKDINKAVKDQQDALEKAKALVEKFAGSDFKLKKDLLDNLNEYEKELIKSTAIFKAREQSRAALQEIDRLEAEYKKQREQLANIQKDAKQNIVGLTQTLQEQVGVFVEKLFGAKELDAYATALSNVWKLDIPNDLKKKLDELVKSPSRASLDEIKKQYENLKKVQAQVDGAAPGYKKPLLAPDTVEALDKQLTVIETFVNSIEKQEARITEQNQRVEGLTKSIQEQTKQVSDQVGVDMLLLNKQREQVTATVDNTTALQAVSVNLVALTEKLKSLGGSVPQPVAIEVPTTEPIKKAMGGMIHGSDNIPALLSRGEFVVNAAATRRFYSQLVAMNGVQRFNNGGLVTNVGDVNINMSASGNTQADIVAIGKGLRREIRRGRIKLS